MPRFDSNSKRNFLEKKRKEKEEKARMDPNLSTALYQHKELLADDPETTNRKLQECVSLVVAKVRRAIRKDRSTLEKELKLLKDAVNIYKNVREIDFRVLEIQLKSKQSQELAQMVINLNNLPDEQLKKLAAEVLNGQHSIEGRDEGRPSIHNEQSTEVLQGEPLWEDSQQHDLLQKTSSVSDKDTEQ